MDLSGLAELVYSLLAGAVLATLIVSYVAAAAGVRRSTPVLRRTLALFCGWFFGVVMAIFAGWAVLDSTDSFGGLLLAPVVGGATAFIVARGVASFIAWSKGRKIKK